MKYAYTLNQLRDDTEGQVMKLFMNYSYTVSHYGKIDANDYLTADYGMIEAETPEVACEKLFVIYNTNLPARYTSRSMSVSDIVNLLGITNDLVESSSWFCDTIGFVRLGTDGKAVLASVCKCKT